MEGLEAVVILGIAVLTGAILAPRLRIAAPLLLLVFGLLLGFVPQLREIQLPPETVLLIFLPVILFWESLTTSLRSIRRDLRGIVLLSTLLVVATAFAVAGIAYLFGLPWNAAAHPRRRPGAARRDRRRRPRPDAATPQLHAAESRESHQ